MGAKFTADRLMSSLIFHQSWSIEEYFRGHSTLMQTPAFSTALVLLAIPFIWCGVALTLRRLRSAGLPSVLVLLFFVPAVKFVLFFLLCVLPERPDASVPPRIGRWPFFDALIPQSKLGAVAAAILSGVGFTLIGTALSTTILRDYGAGLFIGMPFCLGFISVLVYGYHAPRKLGDSVMVSVCCITAAGICLLLFAFEGLLCILMAAPIAAVLALCGGLLAHVILQSARWSRGSGSLLCSAILALPVTLTTEHFVEPPAPLLCVKTSVDINAPATRVWTNVVSFSRLPEKREWLFHSGIAYPTSATIEGRGPGAVRLCNFSTGPFVEPIEIWDEPRLLRFSVTKNPEPMQEWTPYHEIHPPHLNGFLSSERGQFLLTPTNDNRTHLEGTTWYRHHMWPASYWQVWSDFIIHHIHKRVLDHVKNLSETS
jgi:hypothetical protein